MVPHTPTPAWIESCMDRITKGYDPDALDALLDLLATIAPTEDEEKYKHELAWIAIQHGYRQTEDCSKSCYRYLGVAV